MDGKTAEIRYQHWVQIIQDWSSSGLTKRAYCKANGIEEKTFYYYQRRIRSMVAKQAEQQRLTDASSSLEAYPSTAISQYNPPIIKLRLPNSEQANNDLVSFSVNGICLSVPENITETFLAKLLEAANHGTR